MIGCIVHGRAPDEGPCTECRRQDELLSADPTEEWVADEWAHATEHPHTAARKRGLPAPSDYAKTAEGRSMMLHDYANHPKPWAYCPECRRFTVYRGSWRIGSVNLAADGRWYVGTPDLAEHPSFASDTEAIAYLSGGGPCVVEPA